MGSRPAVEMVEDTVAVEAVKEEVEATLVMGVEEEAATSTSVHIHLNNGLHCQMKINSVSGMAGPIQLAKANTLTATG